MLHEAQMRLVPSHPLVNFRLLDLRRQLKTLCFTTTLCHMPVRASSCHLADLHETRPDGARPDDVMNAKSVGMSDLWSRRSGFPIPLPNSTLSKNISLAFSLLFTNALASVFFFFCHVWVMDTVCCCSSTTRNSCGPFPNDPLYHLNSMTLQMPATYHRNLLLGCIIDYWIITF